MTDRSEVGKLLLFVFAPLVAPLGMTAPSAPANIWSSLWSWYLWLSSIVPDLLYRYLGPLFSEVMLSVLVSLVVTGIVFTKRLPRWIPFVLALVPWSLGTVSQELAIRQMADVFARVAIFDLELVLVGMDRIRFIGVRGMVIAAFLVMVAGWVDWYRREADASRAGQGAG